MFGLAKVDGLNRTQYNSRVKSLLENKIGIETDNSRNLRFPGFLTFLQLVDQGWHQKCCPEDNALFIALSYWEGCAKAGGDSLLEARRIDKAITDFMMEIGMSGKVSEARGRQFAMFYDDHCWRLSCENSFGARPPHVQGQPPVLQTPSDVQGGSTEPAQLRCPTCNQRLNAPSGKRLRLTCPVCKHEWEQNT